MSTVALAQSWVFFLLYLGAFIAILVALLDLLRRPADAFARAGKRTKGFWGAILGVAAAVGFVAIPWPIGIGQLGFLALAGLVAAIVYLVDVRPALGPTRRKPGPSTGGW